MLLIGISNRVRLGRQDGGCLTKGGGGGEGGCREKGGGGDLATNVMSVWKREEEKPNWINNVFILIIELGIYLT